MILNPELRRNLWLEFTVTRLVGMPLVLGALFFLAWLGDDHHFGTTVRGVSIALFVAISMLWGSRQAAESIFGELRERTWDWQRLSAIGPWTLTWGKLLGSTLYTWYGGIIALFFFLLSDSALQGKSPLVSMLTLMATALLAQAVSMVVSLQSVSRDRTVSGSHTTAIVIMALFVIYPLGMAGISTGFVNWYGWRYPVVSFALVSLTAFAFWAITGTCRLVCLEFRMRAVPVAWTGFVLFLIVYCTGFLGKEKAYGEFSVWLAVSMAVTGSLVYLTALLERKDPVALRGLLDLFRHRDWKGMSEVAPCWLLSLSWFLVSAVLLIALPGGLTKEMGQAGGRALVVAFAGFLLRDVGLILYLSLAKQSKRADLFAVLCVAVLYGLLPGILNLMDLKSATALFWPLISHWQVSLVAAPVEAALVWWMLSGRWRGQGRE